MHEINAVTHESRLDQQYHLVKRPQAKDSPHKKTSHVDDPRLPDFPKHQGHYDVSTDYKKERYPVFSMVLKLSDPTHARGGDVVGQHQEYG